jgi:hypothetical protein
MFGTAIAILSGVSPLREKTEGKPKERKWRRKWKTRKKTQNGTLIMRSGKISLARRDTVGDMPFSSLAKGA